MARDLSLLSFMPMRITAPAPSENYLLPIETDTAWLRKIKASGYTPTRECAVTWLEEVLGDKPKLDIAKDERYFELRYLATK